MSGDRTVSDSFGEDIADRLARWAIDALCDAPEKIATLTTKIDASLVEGGREILEQAGIDWRKRVRDRVQAERAAADRANAERFRRIASKRLTDDLERLLERLPHQATAQRKAIEDELQAREEASHA